MQFIEASKEQLDDWLFLRRQLWPDLDEDNLREMQEILASRVATAFLLFDDEREAVGFIEGALYVDGPQKYGYVEGWYVAPAYRGKGWGGRLLDTLQQWVLHHSISLVLSDTIPEEYPLSARAHQRNGYKELMTLQIFMKQLG